MNGEGHGEAARDQHDGVERAGPDDQLVARRREVFRIPAAIHRIRQKEAAEEQHELQAEDLNIAVFDGEGIELDDLVREELLLALPVNVLCREDCKGLCPQCGQDLNLGSCECEPEVDARLSVLKALLQNEP